MTRIKFKDFASVLSKIGGIISIMRSSLFFFKGCLQRMFRREMAKKAYQKKKGESVNQIEKEIILQRFSYEGLNDLYDRMDAVERSTQDTDLERVMKDRRRQTGLEADKVRELEAKVEQLQHNEQVMKLTMEREMNLLR